VRVFCAAAGRGDPESFPKLVPKRTERIAVTRVWCERKGSLLLHRTASDARRLAGQHELPTAEHLGLSPTAAAKGLLLATKKRGITRFQITESIHVAPPPRQLADRGLVWVPFSDLDSITLSGPHRRWIAEIRQRT
jgi:A/G-specific adenine glycosylase